MYIVDSRLDVNVALNRPSYLSSTLTVPYPYPASKGNDGDKINCNALSPSNSVAHSLSEPNPWYVVDLGVELHVAGVKFTNRADGNRERDIGLLLYCRTKLRSQKRNQGWMGFQVCEVELQPIHIRYELLKSVHFVHSERLKIDFLVYSGK